jgi:hypothetical protein
VHETSSSGRDTRYEATRSAFAEASTTPLSWRRSTLCSANSCVEVATLPTGETAVRDSKQLPEGGPMLVFSTAEWASFVLGVKHGEFD